MSPSLCGFGSSFGTKQSKCWSLESQDTKWQRAEGVGGVHQEFIASLRVCCTKWTIVHVHFQRAWHLTGNSICSISYTHNRIHTHRVFCMQTVCCVYWGIINFASAWNEMQFRMEATINGLDVIWWTFRHFGPRTALNCFQLPLSSPFIIFPVSPVLFLCLLPRYHSSKPYSAMKIGVQLLCRAQNTCKNR